LVFDKTSVKRVQLIFQIVTHYLCKNRNSLWKCKQKSYLALRIEALYHQDRMMKKLSQLMVTVFGIGYLPAAPGTFGSLFGLGLGGGLLTFCPQISLWIAIFIVLALGVFFIPVYLKAHPGKKDPSEIVIDEVLGQLVALILCHTLFQMVCAFVFFRVFDIWKPWPVSWADGLGGGLTKDTTGILLDDVLAGLLVLAGVWVLF